MMPIQVDGDIDLVTIGYAVTLPLADRKYASVQTVTQGTSYSTAVLTVKGSLNGTDFVALNEATISADGIYGPYYVAGMVAVRLEVTTVASSSLRMLATWRGWGCLDHD